MDCDTARTLLGFRRPGGPAELPPDDLAALDRHLAGCPDCGPAARRRDGFDAAVAAAMLAVPVPAGLQGRLMARAAAAEAADFRRRAGTVAAAVVAAFAAGGLVYGGVRAARPPLDPQDIATAADRTADAPEAAVRDWLRAEGLPELPFPFDYNLRPTHGWEPLAGRAVPAVTFSTRRPGQGPPDTLTVLLLRDDQFKLGPVLEDGQGSFFSAQVLRDDRARTGVVYVGRFSLGAGLPQFLKSGAVAE